MASVPSIPFGVTLDDIVAVLDVLAGRIKPTPIDELTKVSSNASRSAAEAAAFLGLCLVDGDSVSIAGPGRQYVQQTGTGDEASILWQVLKDIEIYDLTLERSHHESLFQPTKVEVASYWNEHFTSVVKELSEEDLGRAAIFYFQLLDAAGLGKYVRAGRGRETHIEFDQVALAKYVTTSRQAERKPTIERPKAHVPTDDEPTPSDAIQSPGGVIPNETDEKYLSSLRILKKLNIELTWKDLDSDGAKKLIIDRLDELKSENTVLSAKVEKYQRVEVDSAVLQTRVRSLSRQNIFQTSVNALGGIVAGSFLGMPTIELKVASVIVGFALIILSLFVVEKDAKRGTDRIGSD